MSTVGSKVLSKMLDRLLAGLMSGPNMNCRPHNSRQRVDLTALSKLADIAPHAVLKDLLGTEKCARVIARIKVPRKPADDEEHKSPAQKAWIDQSALINKLRLIADDARTYENDTGVHALSIGFPILSLPPGSFAGGARSATKRILAPVAFIPVTLSLKGGATPSIELTCRGEGADRVLPNTALLSWIEQQTGQPQKPDGFEDEEGGDPWREIGELVQHVAGAMRLNSPEFRESTPSPGTPGEGRGEGDAEIKSMLDEPNHPHPNPLPEYRERDPDSGPLIDFKLQPAPRGDDESDQPAILLSAVLGLFPTSHQGLLRDTRAMIAQTTPLAGPIQNFLTSGIDFDAPATPATPAPMTISPRTLTSERLAAAADPCQARAVALAREAAGLVVHGPPGTGKSQTITNIIADHLARGQRVLLVCDKRTALDVVADRLDHMGLRSLCGIVHDPQRDQRDLYRSIHQQLDDLPEAKLFPRAQASLEKADAELQQLHDELTTFHQSLMIRPVDDGLSFHELMGRWMASQSPFNVRLDPAHIAGISVDQLQTNKSMLLEMFQRAQAVDFSRNVWDKCAGLSLADFLSRQMDALRLLMERLVNTAATTDTTGDDRIVSFNDRATLIQQAHARTELLDQLTELFPKTLVSGLAILATKDTAAVAAMQAKIAALSESVRIFQQGPLDHELASIPPPPVGQIRQDLFTLEQYLEASKKWSRFFAFGINSAAGKLLKQYALPRTPANAERVKTFLIGLQARLALSPLVGSTLASDEPIEAFLQTAAAWLPLLQQLNADPALAGIGPALSKLYDACGFAEPETADQPNPTADFLEGLKRSAPRAEAIQRLDDELHNASLFDPKWIAEFQATQGAAKLAKETITALFENLETLEGVLRVRALRASLAPALHLAADQLLSQVADADDVLATLNQSVLSAEITQRLRANPTLLASDTHRISANFDRYRELDQQKKKLVRDVIAHLWVSKQKDRLLAATGSRLNSTGADLRRRLTSRGTRAMRLRQVIAIGDSIEGGDPLFDLCPVWMASPETVAQIFARKPIFDVVVFDEASQCRLEEALPVLTRGQRVVIAGDPNQLPPTRFFESGLVQSEDEDPQTDQELFETQQGEVEDLLAAALNLAIQQCYLDVHYRSRNADLIEFSNRYFYASRLQAIPAHPAKWSKFPPLTLYRVDGIYNKRQNEAEADRVVQIVHNLLRRADPPSIGIACLNLPQRDLITEKLDDLAGEDPEFAKRLATARIRRGQGSFEGLFVKNLENVQGDERDDIIISTTYGPDTKGKFYRRFGPLGMAGGGRRLNVLVTRARCEVHLVTSIPVESYRNLPAIPEGQSATGAWLLFAYLKYAEELSMKYENANVEHPTPDVQIPVEEPVNVNVLETQAPSLFSRKLAERLADKSKLSSDVHWGNEGFCVDVALHPPGRPSEVTLGLLCDGCRYTAAGDVVEWDIFRTGILTAQGWTLRRIWTPHFFRDPAGNLKEINKAASAKALLVPSPGTPGEGEG